MKKLQEELPLYVRDPHEGVVWKRSGGCTVGCGACCEYMVLPLHPVMLQQPAARLADWIKWAGYHGIEVWVDHGEGTIEAHVPLVCSKLETDEDGDKTCGVYGTDDRPLMCERFPRHPLELDDALAKVCTYTFEKVGAKHG